MATIENVVLVHGAWADGSCWAKVIPGLRAAGLAVTAVQLPLTSFAEDLAALRRALALVDGPLALVGHSYGGAVITEAGTDAKVAALVYVAAFAPAAGESAGSLLGSVPPSPIAAEFRPDAAGFLKLTERGVVDSFAQDLDLVARQTLFATQAPTSVESVGGTVTEPAWKTRPSWYLLTSEDRAIDPALQKMMAERAGAKTSLVGSSHVPMLSQPERVLALILEAAR